MKKNIFLAHLFLLPLLITSSALLSMEESVIVVPEPKKRGLGLLRSSYDLLWHEEENLLNDLRDKKFDVENSSYHRKLDTAIELFVEKEKVDKLAEIFSLCQANYPKQVKIGDSQAVMAHKFLVKENKTRQSETKHEIQRNDKLYLEKQNERLAEAKKVFTNIIASMDEIHKEHMLERNNLITKNCDEIRKMKKASVDLHKLNKTFTLPNNQNDGYCSDNEQDIKNPKNIATSYNDQHILNKIEITEKIEETNEKINALLVSLVELESKLNALQSLQY